MTGNVISGTLYGDGIDLEASNSLIEGNKIGTDATGTTSIPNGGEGVIVFYYTTGVTIGGTVAGAGNVISNNGESGINLYAADTSFRVITIENNVCDGVTIDGYAFSPSAGQHDRRARWRPTATSSPTTAGPG